MSSYNCIFFCLRTKIYPILSLNCYNRTLFVFLTSSKYRLFYCIILKLLLLISLMSFLSLTSFCSIINLNLLAIYYFEQFKSLITSWKESSTSKLLLVYIILICWFKEDLSYFIFKIICLFLREILIINL